MPPRIEVLGRVPLDDEVEHLVLRLIRIKSEPMLSTDRHYSDHELRAVHGLLLVRHHNLSTRLLLQPEHYTSSKYVPLAIVTSLDPNPDTQHFLEYALGVGEYAEDNKALFTQTKNYFGGNYCCPVV
jgi:hypothetical protein